MSLCCADDVKVFQIKVEPQEWRCSLDQETPGSAQALPQIKVESVWSDQRGQQLAGTKGSTDDSYPCTFNGTFIPHFALKLSAAVMFTLRS